jgi:hypothetical protein
MRTYGLYDTSRGLTTALSAGVAGLALWGATQVGTQTPGHFWTAMVIVAAGGFFLALSQHVGSWTKGLRLRVSPGTFALGFLPVLVVVGWILLAMQPTGGWERGTIHSWSTSMGILGVIHDIGLWRGVLAFGFGVVLAFCFDAVPATAPEEEVAAPYATTGLAAPPRAADEPVTAERPHAAPAPSRERTRVE